jgi:hypothetical protein
MKSAHSRPRSESSLSIVLRATPVERLIARIDMPSTMRLMIWPRCSVLNLFILNIMLDLDPEVKPSLPGKHSRATRGGRGLGSNPDRGFEPARIFVIPP